MSQIRVEQLSKTYRIAMRDPGLAGAVRGLFHRRQRDVRALDNVSFSLAHGELLGFIGPNGAGKSTTIKILSGILRPTSGHCEVDGLVPWEQRIAHVARIGVVFGQRTQLWWDLPIVESFELLRDIYRVEPGRFVRTRDRLVDMLKIAPLLDTPMRQLSLGQRMRCEIAAALLHTPSVLFLDEPTIGLDAVSKLALRDFVRDLNRTEGVTVILTTHDMHDIEALARRVIIIGNGRLLRDSSFESMRNEVLGERRLIVDFAADASDLTVEGADVRARNGRTVEFAFDPARTAAHTLIARIAAAREVVDIRVEDPKIEEVIARFYTLHGALEIMTALALPYLSVLRARYALMLQYRAAAFAGFATQCWWGVIKVMVLAAFYAGAGHQPISLAQAITYTWLGQAFLALLPWQADGEISEAVESGNVAYERLRPVDTHLLWLARAVAMRAANTSLRLVPMFVLAAIVLPLTGLADWSWRLPANPAAAALFALSITLTVLLSSSFTVLLNIAVTALKTRRAAALSPVLVTPLSGMIVPLALMPDWTQTFLFWQPFAGLVDIPYRIYFGNLAGMHALAGIAAQLLWIAIFIAAGRAWMNRVMARVDMQGS